MANFIYNKAKEAMLSGMVDISTKKIRALLIDNSLYTANINSDQYVSQIPASAIKKRSGDLQDVVFPLGIINATDLIITDHDGSAFNSIVCYQVGTSDSNSILLFYIDTATGLPFPGSNSEIPVYIIWDNGPNKIIAL